MTSVLPERISFADLESLDIKPSGNGAYVYGAKYFLDPETDELVRRDVWVKECRVKTAIQESCTALSATVPGIETELRHSIIKHGTWAGYSIGQMLDRIADELKEVDIALTNKDINGPHGVLKELEQVAACCIKAIRRIRSGDVLFGEREREHCPDCENLRAGVQRILEKGKS